MSSRRNTDPSFEGEELRALVQLRMLPALADDRLKSLLSRLSPLSILKNASSAQLGAAAFRARNSDAVARRVDGAMRMIEKLRVSVVTVQSSAYPQQFDRLGKFAPAVLFCRGRVDLMQGRSIAIVGARDSTEYGDSVAELFATDLAQRRIVVVSGLARGIDSVAHASALDAGGRTIAVLGCGVDVYYPPRNARLQERVAEEGLLISEFAPGAPALRHHFPQRNRLIALLCGGVIVVEAGPKSGTRVTVDWALDHGVEVFAVPGPIGRYECQGTNEIIQQGSKLVMSIRDVLDELKWNDRQQVAVRTTPPASKNDGPVYEKVDATALHVDEIARRCGRPVSDTLVELMQLELAGLVRQHPGKRFSRVLSSG